MPPPLARRAPVLIWTVVALTVAILWWVSAASSWANPPIPPEPPPDPYAELLGISGSGQQPPPTLAALMIEHHGQERREALAVAVMFIVLGGGLLHLWWQLRRVLPHARTWHGGKLPIVWGVAVAIGLLGAAALPELEPTGPDEAIILGITLAALCAAAVVPPMTTWVWLTAREHGHDQAHG